MLFCSECGDQISLYESKQYEDQCSSCWNGSDDENEDYNRPSPSGITTNAGIKRIRAMNRKNFGIDIV